MPDDLLRVQIIVLKKTVNYIRTELDYPIEADMRFLRRKGINYHLDFRKLNKLYLSANIRFDDKGVPRFDYSIVPPPNNQNGLIYSITYICWYALGRLQDYLETNDTKAKDSFLTQADWLLDNKTTNNDIVSWAVRFPWNIYGEWLPIPRVSSMDQGLAISVLVRAYLLTSNKKYLDTAKQAELFYDFSLAEGGFKCYLLDGSIFYEMYPSKRLSLILDGHIFAMMGLYDLYSLTSNKQTKYRFDQTLKMVINNIEYWNYHNIWSWIGRFYLCSPIYHKINLCWLRILSEISGENKLYVLADNWTQGYRDRLLKYYLKSRIFMSSRLFFITNGRLDTGGRDRIV